MMMVMGGDIPEPFDGTCRSNLESAGVVSWHNLPTIANNMLINIILFSNPMMVINCYNPPLTQSNSPDIHVGIVPMFTCNQGIQDGVHWQQGDSMLAYISLITPL